MPEDRVYTVACDSYAIQMTITPSAVHKEAWQTFSWTAHSEAHKMAFVTLRVDVVGNGLPQ